MGFGLGLSLAAPPGPVMAQIAFETARGRWRAGALVGVGASVADATFFTIVYLGLLRLAPPRRLLGALAFAGVALMDYFAYVAWRAARRPLDARPARLAGFAAGYALAATSPFNFAWWFTSGAPLVSVYGLPLALGFFPALLVTVAASVALVAYGSARVARLETYVAYASAALLGGFATFLAFQGFRFVATG